MKLTHLYGDATSTVAFYYTSYLNAALKTLVASGNLNWNFIWISREFMNQILFWCFLRDISLMLPLRYFQFRHGSLIYSLIFNIILYRVVIPIFNSRNRVQRCFSCHLVDCNIVRSEKLQNLSTRKVSIWVNQYFYF